MTVSDGPTAAEQFLARRRYLWGVGSGCWVVWLAGFRASSGRYPGAKLCPTVACRQTPIDRRGRSVRFIGFVGYSFHTSLFSACSHTLTVRAAATADCAGRIHFRVVVHTRSTRLARTEDLHLDEVYTLVERITQIARSRPPGPAHIDIMKRRVPTL